MTNRYENCGSRKVGEGELLSLSYSLQSLHRKWNFSSLLENCRGQISTKQLPLILRF